MLNEADIRSVYQASRAMLLALARRSVPCEADAEDVLHEAFVRFFERAPRRMKTREARRYLVRCVSNGVADWWRRAGRSTSMADEPVADCTDPSAGAARAEQIDRLRAAIGRLPDRQRTAVTLCYLAQKSADEAADLMGCRPATVRSLLRHGLERLRNAVPAKRVQREEAWP